MYCPTSRTLSGQPEALQGFNRSPKSTSLYEVCTGVAHSFMAPCYQEIALSLPFLTKSLHVNTLATYSPFLWGTIRARFPFRQHSYPKEPFRQEKHTIAFTQTQTPRLNVYALTAVVLSSPAELSKIIFPRSRNATFSATLFLPPQQNSTGSS